jgi:hypothetical protein
MENLEDRLVSEKRITPEQLYKAKQEAASSAKSIWPTLIKLGYLSEEEIALFFGEACGIPYVRISDYKISQETLSLIDEDFCLQNLAIPLFKIKDTLFVACGNPLDMALMDGLKKMSGYFIEPLIATAHSILSALDLYWRLEDKNFAAAKFITKQDSIVGFGLWREAERLNLKLPVDIRLSEEPIILSSSQPIDCNTYNITKDGTAVGLGLSLFLPKGLKIDLEFRLDQNAGEPSGLKAKGVIVHSRMAGQKQYLLGVKFIEIADNNRSRLLGLTG